MKAKRIAKFNIAQSQTRMTVMLGQRALKNIALQQNYKVSRHNDQILVYKAWYEGGFVQYYVNNSTNIVLEEKLMFELENMQIDGMENEKVYQVKVLPGKEQLINII